jgi:2-polyprenyl-3-methyl-5-hydroxy-6-metoxy-1,4-benzoquinol methylase
MVSEQVCEVCASKDVRHYVRIRNYDAWKCGSCKFFWLNCQVPDGAVYPNWDGPDLEDYERYFGALRRLESIHVIEIIRRLHNSPMDFLDVGFGLGFFIDEVRHRFPSSNVTGVEDDAFASNHVRKRLAGDTGLTIADVGFMQAGASELGKFDVISMLDVFEHVPNPRLVLDRVKQLLRDEGLFVCKVPSSNGVFFRLIHQMHRFSLGGFRSVVALVWQVETAYPHIWYFNEDNLRALLESAGFEIIATSWYPLLARQQLEQRVQALKPSRFRSFLSSFVGNVLLRGLAAAQYLVPETSHDDLTVFARRKNRND